MGDGYAPWLEQQLEVALQQTLQRALQRLCMGGWNWTQVSFSVVFTLSFPNRII